MKISELLSSLAKSSPNPDQVDLLNKAAEMVRSEEYRNDREAEKEKNLSGAREQAFAQMSSISEMVAALNCDYDRLQELREDRKDLIDAVDEAETDEEKAICQRAFDEWSTDYRGEVTDLEDAAGDCENEEEARERIQEDALDISVRSDWQNVGETLEPSEFTILLCTGGPAVRIVGELDQYKQPCRAWLEYQDWFTPWTELVDGVSHSDLLTYSQQFYFGE